MTGEKGEMNLFERKNERETVLPRPSGLGLRAV